MVGFCGTDSLDLDEGKEVDAPLILFSLEELGKPLLDAGKGPA